MIVASSTVKRVVSCFILSSSPSHNNNNNNSDRSDSMRDSLHIAVFQRKSTMPTFPSHWAGVSGSIEEGEEPHQTAMRELQEETNIDLSTLVPPNKNCCCSFDKAGGLYLDVPFQPNRAIRVYPFVVHWHNQEEDEDNNVALELRGTEHDTHQFISVAQLEALDPAVPGLATAFHHATYGKYLEPTTLPSSVWKWSQDKVNGATTLARQAIQLAISSQLEPEQLATMATLRPTMVPIVNVLKVMQQKLEQGQDPKTAGEAILTSIDQQVERSIQLGVEALQKIHQEKTSQVCTTTTTTQSQSTPLFTVATFSRSSTLLKLLQRFLASNNNNNNDNLRILCAKSTPGDEGELMAEDLLQLTPHVECIPDDALHQAIRDKQVNVVLVGCDCVLPTQNLIVNKIGTKALAETCQLSSSTACSILCCADRWKIWDDAFPPPLEDMFECVPQSLMDQVILPPAE